ncbi:MAG: hypothetical protein F2825_00135 [Actinobacteria bacterium]|nr:hypothetical protein [Actinomycetota bacterium]
MRHLKLQQPERPRIRVRDLAREVGMRDVELLSWLRTNGEWTKSVLSFLEDPVAAKVRRHFRQDQDVERAPVDDSARPNSPRSPGLTPPRVRPARENNPFLGQLGASGPTRQVPRPAEPSRPLEAWSVQDPVSDYSAAGSPPASETMAPFEWAVRGVEEHKQAWLAHGLGPNDARLAAACQNAGLAPTDLALSVSGWTVLDRITHGEPPREVARLLARQREQQRDSG